MSTAYLLDTNVVSAYIVENHKFHHYVHSNLDALEANVFVSVITIGEMHFGLKSTRIPLPLSVDAAIRQDLAAFIVIPITHHIAKSYADLREALFRRYAPKDARGRAKTKLPEQLVDSATGLSLGIQENDLWYAATALTHQFTVLTLDGAGGMRRILTEGQALGLHSTVWTP